MSQAHSISTRRRFGMPRVCRIWGAPRATVYRRRAATESAEAANAGRPPKRRGPQGACSDAHLLTHIEAVIAASPFSGEGYRKVRARLRAQGVRTAARRVRRVMNENNLLAPQRPVQRDAHPHDGTIVTDRVDEVWGTDMSQTITTQEGHAYSRGGTPPADHDHRSPCARGAGGHRNGRHNRTPVGAEDHRARHLSQVPSAPATVISSRPAACAG
ncbi:MAG: IS3 family transposase [Roseovarius sp.]